MEEDGHTEIRPHAWSVGGERQNLCCKHPRWFECRGPGRQSGYEASAAAYLAQLDALDAEVKAAIEKFPPTAAGSSPRTTPSAISRPAYGVSFIAPQGVSTESEVSAKDVAKIITQIRKQRIPAVFLENVTDDRLLKRIGAESGARIGGTLYSDALTDGQGAAPSYLDMMRHNVRQLAQALMS
jgi:zinc/manganese transport system substrate-binding protein